MNKPKINVPAVISNCAAYANLSKSNGPSFAFSSTILFKSRAFRLNTVMKFFNDVGKNSGCRCFRVSRHLSPVNKAITIAQRVLKHSSECYNEL